ncbi:MAG: ankyrin repeat domain-containing protein [Verrucomicrobiales bacterium]
MAIGIVSFVPACSDKQEEAKATLESTSYQFTVDDYLEAASLGKMEPVRKFLEAGMRVDSDDSEGNTALLLAAKGGHAAMVDYLIAQGADVNYVGPGWETPLISAARSGDVATVKRLLDAGAKADQKNEDNWSPLTVAAFEGHSEVADILAPLSRAMLDDALQLASLQGHLEVMHRLLNNGASVYARSREGEQTPLMFAAANGHLDAVRLLLGAGANRFALDENDRTASEQASNAGFPEVAALLSEPPSADELRPSTIEDLAPGILAQYERAAASLAVNASGSGLPDAPTFANSTSGGSSAESEMLLRTSFTPRGDGQTQQPSIDEDALAGAIAGGPAGSAAAAYVAPYKQEIATHRLAGAVVPTIPSAHQLSEMGNEGVEGVFHMHEYRESQLPVMLTSVPAKGTAEVRVLYGDSPAKSVKLGDRIPGTNLEVLRIEPKLVPSKQGNGQLVDMSRIMVEDRLSGERHLIVKDVPARSSEPFAVMSFGDAYSLYDVRAGDEFTGADGKDSFRVNEVRMTSVLIENLRSGEVFTIAKAASRDF